jgi:hypothetical protein
MIEKLLASTRAKTPSVLISKPQHAALLDELSHGFVLLSFFFFLYFLEKTSGKAT